MNYEVDYEEEDKHEITMENVIEAYEKIMDDETFPVDLSKRVVTEGWGFTEYQLGRKEDCNVVLVTTKDS